MASPDTYFAALPPGDIGDELFSRVESYGAAGSVTASITGRLNLAYQYYFGLDPSGIHATSQVLRDGDQGELAAVRVNHSRSLVNTLLNLIIGPKVVWQPKATNRDYESLKETTLASAVLEYYWSEADLARYATRALEEAIVFTEGFVLVQWDEYAGEDTQADPLDPSRTLKAGDLVFRNVSSWDVIRDPTRQSYDQLDWIIVRLWRNKHDLAAEYAAPQKPVAGPDGLPDPEAQQKALETELLRNEILSAPADIKTPAAKSGVNTENYDDVACYYFFHRPTPSVPAGREVVFLPNRTVLRDSALTYEEIPLYRVSPAELIGTPYGYSPYLEVLGIQELMDSLESSIASNQTTFGAQNIAVPVGTDIDDLAGGGRAFYVPPDASQKPEAMQLCRTPAEIFSHLETKKRDQELLMGLNSVVRGTVPGSPKEMSGAALALLQSQALQQSSVLQSNYLRLIEALGMAVLRILQKRASEPRKVDLVGKQSRYLVEEESFTGQSLSRVKKVQVEIGNPMSQTAAGRLEMAKMLLQTPGVAEKLQPEQLEQVLISGRIEPLTHSMQDELMLVLSENEDIGNGVTPPVLVHDDALLHCREHRSTLASPNARKNPAVLKAAMDHIHSHYAAYFGVPLMPDLPVPQMPGMPPLPPVDQFANVKADPLYRDRMLFLMGFPPTPPPLMMLPMGPGAMPPGGPPPEGGPGPNGEAPPPKPKGLPNGPASAKMPSPPKNPATGVPWNPVDGGGMVPPPSAS